MNVRSNFFVAICVWQIIWSANGLKLSLCNLSSKSAPVKPPSSNSPLKNTVSSTGETSQASFLSNIRPKPSILNQEIIGNGLNFPIGGNRFPPSPSIAPLNTVTPKNVINNSLKDIETTNIGASAFDPLSYQSLLSTSTTNLETSNKNLLSAIKNSLSVQNNNFVTPQSITPTQLLNNGLRDSVQNAGALQTNNNLISFTQNGGLSQSNIVNNKAISRQNVLESNSLTNNDLLSTVRNSLNSQNSNIIPPQSLTSSSLINDLSLQNIGPIPPKPLVNNIFSSPQNNGLLSPISKTDTLPLQAELLESKILSNLLTNSLNLESVPLNQLTQTLGTIQPNKPNNNLLSGTQNDFFNTINNNIQPSAYEKLLQNSNENKNAIQTSSNLGSQISAPLSNNLISSPNIGQINNAQSSNINSYFRNLGPLQTNMLNNVQSSQNVLSSQTDITSNQLLNPSFAPSTNSINKNVPIISSLSQSNSDLNTIQSTIISNNNLINYPSGAASIANSNNVLLNPLTVNNLLPPQIPTTEETISFIQNGFNANPVLSETMLNKIALSELLSQSPSPITNPYNKVTLPTPAEVPIQNNILTNSNVVSNYNKNVLLQQLNNNINQNALLNNNNLQAQNLITSLGSQNVLPNNAAQPFNLEKALLQNLLASKLAPPDNVLNYSPLNNFINQNNIFGENNQNLINNFSNKLRSSNISNIESYLYNDLIKKLQSPKPINSKVNSKIDANNQININPYENNIRIDTQALSGQASADILAEVNNLPRIPPSPPASLKSLIKSNMNNPNKAYLEYLTQITSPPTQILNGVPATEYSVPTVPNYPNILNLPQRNNFAPIYDNLYDKKFKQQPIISPFSLESPQINPEIVSLDTIRNFQNLPQSIRLEPPTVPILQCPDISGSSEIKTANSISSLYPLLSNLNPTPANLGSYKPEFSTSQAIYPTSIVQPSLLQSLYPITGLPSVNTNLGPIDNNFVLNRNFQNNAHPNLVSISALPNINVNRIAEGLQIEPNPYLASDKPTPELINRLKLLDSFAPIYPDYSPYPNLITKDPSPFPIPQNVDLFTINKIPQLTSLNNVAETTAGNLIINPYITSNPIQTYNNVYSSLGIDSSMTTNIFPNTQSTEVLSDDKISVSTSIGTIDSTLDTVTETISTNPYAIPSIADLPNVLASNYLSLPQLYNNLYNQISPSNLIVPKIENLISTAGLTKSITDLGNEIAKRYIDNLRTKKTKPAYPPVVYNPILPTPNTVSSASETIISNTNISPTIQNQMSYPTNLAIPPPISPSFTESFKEVEQIYSYPFPSLPQPTIQTEMTQMPILPTFYPAEISIYSPSMLPTPNINYPVYSPYIPTPPMNFPPIPPLFPPMPPIIETPILKMGSNGQDTKRLIELLLITGLLSNNDCNDRGALEALIALMLAT